MACLVVASEEVVGAGKLEPDPGQPGPKGENLLETLSRSLRHAKTHLDSAEHEEPLDSFLFTGRTCLLEEGARVLEPTGPDEEPAGLDVGKLRQRKRTLRNVLRPRAGRDRQCDRERGAREGVRAVRQSPYCFSPPKKP